MIRERQYQKVTYKQLIHCLKWCQNYLNLRDWQIDFYEGTRDKEERAEGWTLIDPEGGVYHELAEIWIDCGRCQQRNTNPYVAVCHEAIHILVWGKCKMEGDGEETINYAFQDLLYQEYVKANHIKKVPFKTI